MPVHYEVVFEFAWQYILFYQKHTKQLATDQRVKPAALINIFLKVVAGVTDFIFYKPSAIIELQKRSNLLAQSLADYSEDRSGLAV